jgi:pimeloyl-ACP methyl ester carboxylesterase
LTENLCFIGNSLGSLIGILISQDPSLKTSKLVLSGCPGMNKNINLGIGAVLTPNLNFGRLLVSRLFHNPEIITDEIINRSLEIVNTRLNFFKLIKIIQELDEYSVKDKIDDINIPTLLLWGENDNVTPVKFWADFPKKNKNISLSIIENCGHSPMMEQPTKFNKILNTFINN